MERRDKRGVAQSVSSTKHTAMGTWCRDRQNSHIKRQHIWLRSEPASQDCRDLAMIDCCLCMLMLKHFHGLHNYNRACIYRRLVGFLLHLFSYTVYLKWSPRLTHPLSLNHLDWIHNYSIYFHIDFCQGHKWVKCILLCLSALTEWAAQVLKALMNIFWSIRRLLLHWMWFYWQGEKDWLGSYFIAPSTGTTYYLLPTKHSVI